jgi:hypothetical protein
MKYFKTEIIKTRLFSGGINHKTITQVLHENSKIGWDFEGSMPILKGFIFKKIQEILIFSKEWDNMTKEEKISFSN